MSTIFNFIIIWIRTNSYLYCCYISLYLQKAVRPSLKKIKDTRSSDSLTMTNLDNHPESRPCAATSGDKTVVTPQKTTSISIQTLENSASNVLPEAASNLHITIQYSDNSYSTFEKSGESFEQFPETRVHLFFYSIVIYTFLLQYS